MRYKTVEKGPMEVMGIEIRTTNEKWQVAEDLPPFWGRFWRENIPAQIPNKKARDVLGLYCEYESDHTKPYTFLAGCEITLADNMPEGLVIKHVPRARYALFRIQGEYPHSLMKVWEWVWEGHLQRTFTGDFEVYPTGFNIKENPDMLLYVAIESN